MPAKSAIAAAISAPLLAVAAIATVAGAIAAAPSSSTTSICTASYRGESNHIGDLSAAQLGNAQIIAQAGTDMGVPAPGATIAIATALQQSDLQNLNYGDRDSLGLSSNARPKAGAAPRRS